MNTVRFSAPVQTAFIEEGFDPAFFVALPDAALEEVAAHRLESGARRTFGMVRVTAHIGASRWTTTINAKDGGYFLTIRKVVRFAEGIEEGDEIEVELDLA
jgi:hypothetical protein